MKRFLPFFLLLFFACEQQGQEQGTATKTADTTALAPATEAPAEATTDTVAKALAINWSEVPDSALINVLLMDSTFVLDVKYATTDNFTKQVLYDCEACLLRKVTADSLVRAHEFFKEQGYKIKLFDCYRPHGVQEKMWEMVPDPRYVADPAKGSMHNRGLAVDLSLVDMATGEELEMGSPYDYFGRISHHVYTGHPQEIQQRRDFLKDNLARFGFEPITSEWWHYSLDGPFYEIADEPLPCP